MPLVTVWKSDLKDNLVSRELVDLYQQGEIKLIKEGKNFWIFEVPSDIYFNRIYPKFPEETIKRPKDLYYYEIPLNTKEEFEAIIFVPEGKLTKSFLRKILPPRWFNILQHLGILDEFFDILKRCKKGELPSNYKFSSRNEDGYLHITEITCDSYKMFYKDEEEDIAVIIEPHFESKAGEFWYIYIKYKKLS